MLSSRSLALAVACLALASVLPRAAFAHATQSSVYSKFEATTSGQAVAVVFAFNTPAMLRELQREAAARVDRSNLDGYGDLFAHYVFARFSIANDGQPCEHPPTFARFFWDSAGDHVIAVTKFECATPLDDLVIRSVVTRDMPLPHDLVGDLRHGRSLVRHFFSSTDVEARIALASLADTAPGPIAYPTSDAGMSGAPANAAIPDQERLYEELASRALNILLFRPKRRGTCKPVQDAPPLRG